MKSKREYSQKLQIIKMKKILSILLLFSISLLTFASPKNQDQAFGKLELKKECSMPTFEFNFDAMILSPLDVFAPQALAISFITPKTCEGFQVVAFKPPVQISAGIAETKQITDFEHFQESNYLCGNFLSR